MATPRVVKPSKGNRYYINVNDGGVNPAKGNPTRLNRDLTALPNCVAIYGWFNEIGQRGMKYLTKAWYPYSVITEAKREGLTVTKEPTPGGIMVWTGGKNGDGHVAGCAVVYDDDHILAVESEYYGADWKTYKRRKGNGNWADGCYWMGSNYTYQGCIQNPFMEKDMTRAETEALINEMVPKIIKELEAERSNLIEDKWAKPYIDWAKETGIMVGDPDGNFRPQDPIRREEVAVVSHAIVKTLTGE